MSWFKRKDKKCKHDWENIESINLKEIVASMFDAKLLSEAYYFDMVTIKYKDEYIVLDFKEERYWKDQKVCLLCGECVNSLFTLQQKIRDRLEEEYQEMQASRKRKKLAKQMWKNCN